MRHLKVSAQSDAKPVPTFADCALWPAVHAWTGVGASMSYRSEAYYPQAGHSARYAQQTSARPVTRHAATARDYILGHAGRQVRLGPIAFWIVVGTLVIMGVWSVITATYFAFREDVLTRLIGRQAEMQFAYEDRVAE